MIVRDSTTAALRPVVLPEIPARPPRGSALDELWGASHLLYGSIALLRSDVAAVLKKIDIWIEPLPEDALGQFASWAGQDRFGNAVHRVSLCSRKLLGHSAEVLAASMVHELAHALQFERGLADGSRSYHSMAFAHFAQSLGLELREHPHYGYLTGGLTAAFRHMHRHQLGWFNEAVTRVHREHLPG
jgi:hypothetical protein